MAAHPFRPIEKSLILAYYKNSRIKIEPRQVRIRFVGFQNVPKAPETTNPLSLLLEYKPHYRCSNNSKQFRVTPEYKLPPQVNLLSRGLGYRITFKMETMTKTKDTPPHTVTVEMFNLMTR